ncbi:hypothetical protein QNM97_01435 [Gordonia sp. L191]|uniref:hypothetical protein n=1 Tax=Gordonia sp. L191 TaxID=2982699 RepID=UPI0024C097FA|nr:hypothetical protein [Gordonia sp. L191]WHU47710.1 hypothetical protein QNM97_01435 [Gordonia sp. L191]
MPEKREVYGEVRVMTPRPDGPGLMKPFERWPSPYAEGRVALLHDVEHLEVADHRVRELDQGCPAPTISSIDIYDSFTEVS